MPKLSEEGMVCLLPCGTGPRAAREQVRKGRALEITQMYYLVQAAVLVIGLVHKHLRIDQHRGSHSGIAHHDLPAHEP